MDFFFLFSLVFLACGLVGFSDYLLDLSIYLLVHTLIYAACLYLKLGVPSSADRRRHLPSSSTAFSCNIQGQAINKCFGVMKICTIEISYSLSNPTDAFRYVVFLCSSCQLESRLLLKHDGGASSEVLET
ncbi:unnamed protein product [Brassica rapa]|uniref:Uncharacterized protein n=1 Tax=Brassica campestris TaxID=3711 RepID=A0A3P5ZUK3_BRACM|nr:unnamed protein product [Brassica rapa]VDC75588.1 unnamed protein product [Brassica rapa]